MRCQVCPISHVPNSIFCDECGVYLLKGKMLDTEPLDVAYIKWLGDDKYSQQDAIPEDTYPQDTYPEDKYHSDGKPLAIRLRIGPSGRQGHQTRELLVSLTRPIRLGRADPARDVFPEVDLTLDLGKEHGISRQHASIFQEGSTVKLEDLGSTNGTLLNGVRLDPYMSETLGDGDQIQMGKLLIEVSFDH